jgi:superfamily II DNA or RNA helicase
MGILGIGQHGMVSTDLTGADAVTDMEQLPLDFSHSAAQRQRRERRRLERAKTAPLTLFDTPPSLDVHLHSTTEAVVTVTAGNPDLALLWLTRNVGQVRQLKARRFAFPVAALDRLAWVRPPVQVTLDAACQAVARALWAKKMGLKPLRVRRSGQRLIANSPRWPTTLRVTDAPWTAIAALTRLDVALDVEENAKTLLMTKLGDSKTPVATAGLAGSAVAITTSRPELLESMGLPGLSYAAEQGSGLYRMPILASECLLTMPQIELLPDLRAAINRATAKVRPLSTGIDFPRELYPFQARDAGRALRILETTGGVLLAGDMGSGKTTVALALVDRLETWPMLVVAPLSAFSTWEKQLEEMGRTFHLATGSPSAEWEILRNSSFDVVVVSYDRLFAFVELIEQLSFKAIVADELQRIRTPSSRRSRALRQLAASVQFRIGLSGTPLTNTIADLLPLGAFLVPGEWRPRGNNKELDDMYPGDPVEAIAEHLGSMMVRRRMTDVGARLPKRNDHRVFIELTAEQRRAVADLQAEAEAAKSEGAFEGNEGRMHAFARLMKMRQIINAPSSAGVPGPNPKVRAAIELAEDFLAMDRKGVIFCADRSAFRELGAALNEAGIGWVGIWGATPPHERISNEKKFHNDPNVKVVLCTIQAGGESWSASPTATWLISTSYMYAPSTLSQMEARVYRMNSDPDGPDIEICYIHAQAPGGSLDDRMVEIIAIKKQLFAQVVDRTEHIDDTKVHYSMSDLVYLMTGERDEALEIREKDEKKTRAREQAKKDHAKGTAHKRKSRNKEFIKDDGSQTVTLEQFRTSDGIEVGAEKVEQRGAYVADELFDASELDKEPDGGEASGSLPINNEMGGKDSTDDNDRFDIESDES